MKQKTTLLLTVMLFIAGNCLAQNGEVKFSKSPKSADGSTEFTSGEHIYAHVSFKVPIASLLKIENRPVNFTTEISSGGKLLEEEMFPFDQNVVRSSKSTTMIVPVISNPDPAADVPNFGKNLFAFRLPAVLAKTAPGSYEIEFVLKSYNFKDAGEPLAKGSFKLTIGAGSSAWFKTNEKDSYDALSARGVKGIVVSERDIQMGAVGGTNVITLVNNCGRSVWLRKASGSDKREYRLAPKQEMRYDRDAGYLEEWNFGTKKWTTVTKVWAPGPNGKANICK